MTHDQRLKRGLAAVAAVGLLLTGCATTPHPSPSSAVLSTPVRSPRLNPDPTLARFYHQKLIWKPCDQGQCTELLVPLDYAQPSGRAVRLKVARRAAAGERRGVVVVNPGGPGGSGVSFVSQFDRTGLEHYDIVGWDPRGVSGETTVRCADRAAMDRYLQVDLSPDTEAERVALAKAQREFAHSCAHNTDRAVLANLDTQSSARDLDILRAALGEDGLTYVGLSYGTFLGATYAELFPGRADKMVLDAAYTLSANEVVPQTLGFDRALADFARWCAGAEECRWGSSAEAVQAELKAWLMKLDSSPLRVKQRRLTQSLATVGLAAGLYSGQRGYSWLNTALAMARRGDGAALLAAADALTGRRADGSYGGLAWAFPAIMCADGPRDTEQQAYRRWQDDQAKAPFFGYFYGPQTQCTSWPVPAASQLTFTAAGAGPILVVGTVNDPATPYEDAVDMAQRLQGARLLTYEGTGHGAYGGRSSCIDQAVQAFLTSGVLPVEGKRCPA